MHTVLFLMEKHVFRELNHMCFLAMVILVEQKKSQVRVKSNTQNTEVYVHVFDLSSAKVNFIIFIIF